MTRESERAAVVAEALSWVGTPFRHSTRIKGLGVDCANLLVAAFAGLVDVTFPPYSPDWFLHSDRERLLEVISLHATRVDAPLALGDIATFRFGRAVSHAGIIVALDPLTIVHAYRPLRGVELHDIDEGSGLGRRLDSVWRITRWGGE
jgi:cell wall-associated NlpC family hydrolase